MQKNENRLGYKKTKAGWIPQEWSFRPLGEVLESSKYGCNAPSAENGNTPVVGMKDIQDGRLLLSNLARVDLTEGDQFRFLLEPGDVLINRTNSYDLVGKVGIFDSSDKVAFVSYLVRLRGQKEMLTQQFLSFWLNSFAGRKSIKRIATKGVSQANINPTELRKQCRLPLPPLSEQEAIAGVLQCWDRGIKNLELKIVKKRNVKKGLMQALLSGKIRLPGFGTTEDTEEHGKGRGGIPQGWKEVQLGELLAEKPRYGMNAPGVPFSERLPTYLRITDISERGRFLSGGAVSVNCASSADYMLKQGDLVFARTGATTGKTYLYDTRDGMLVYAGFLIKVTPNPARLVPEFLRSYTETHAYWKWVSVVSTRSGQPGINGHEYASLYLHLPPVDEQNAIASILAKADTEIDTLERKLVLLKDQQRFLLNTLVTGSLRLPKFCNHGKHGIARK